MSRLHAQDKLKTVLKDYFAGLAAPIAWCSSAGPAEILRALGFHVYFPENHGALLGASRTAGPYILRAHLEGYDEEVCSYLTADIGAYLAGETPLTGAYGLPSIPRPDLIVYNTNQCREVAEWFEFYAREFRCPAVGVFPPRHLDEVRDCDIDNVVRQFEQVIETGEQVIGVRMDSGRLSETVRLSRLGGDLWKQVLETAKQVPSPLTFWDGTILMAPIVMMRGTQECVDFYRETLEELQQLADAGAAAVPGEEARLYWEGMPIWGRLRALSEWFAENRVAVVASTYCNSWVFDHLDARRPLPTLADDYTRIFINRSEDAKLNILKQLLHDYRVDGIVYHDSKTCFNNTNSRFGLPRRLQEATGIPSLTINGDLNDLRFFSEGQTRTRIETFVERLRTRSRSS
jgi:benzoyl-CoA reductase/2-hydroxyglutaryl-CoA dehydratase subunit BcrC/BadD/HgdB